MNELELPEDKMDIAQARILWAASFLVDWLIPLIKEKRIHTPDQIIKLRPEFMLPGLENRKGIDFTISDVLAAAVQGLEYDQKMSPKLSIDALPNGKEMRKAIDLLTQAVHPPPQSEHWTQTTFLKD